MHLWICENENSEMKRLMCVAGMVLALIGIPADAEDGILTLDACRQMAITKNKTLDQQLQLYKQLEVEKKLNEAVQNLRNLSEELDKNAKNTENKSISKGQVQQKQKQIQEQYNEVKKDIHELLKMNKELEEPTKFKDT